nr:hypothetical protein [Kitasatospora aureofaciens]
MPERARVLIAYQESVEGAEELLAGRQGQHAGGPGGGQHVVVAGHRLQSSLQHPGQCRCGIGVVGGRPDDGPHPLVEARVQHGPQERGLVGEAAEERGGPDTGPARHVVQVGVGALFGEDLPGSQDDLLRVAGGVGTQQSGRVGGHPGSLSKGRHSGVDQLRARRMQLLRIKLGA